MNHHPLAKISEVTSHKQLCYKKIFLLSDADKDYGLFDDLATVPDIIIKYVGLKKTHFVLIRKTIFTLNRLFKKSLSFPYWMCDYRIDDLLESYSIRQIVIRNYSMDFIPIKYIQSLKRNGISFTLLLLDSMDAGSFTIKKNRHNIRPELWDRIITFDPVDAAKYNFDFWGFCYYSKPDIRIPDKFIYDIYYIAFLKGNRTELINETFRFLKKNAVNCHFDILPAKKDDTRIEGINYLKRSLPYREMLKMLSKSKCVLEIIQENQSGPSLRYFEAIFFNKKLLTNNPHIVEFPYYNPEYMKIFSKPEDIDIEWLRKDIDVDYHYKGEFSPVNFLNKLRQLD